MTHCRIVQRRTGGQDQQAEGESGQAGRQQLQAVPVLVLFEPAPVLPANHGPMTVVAFFFHTYLPSDKKDKGDGRRRIYPV